MLHKCFLLLLLLLAAPTLTPAGVIEQVLVVVNGEPYTLSNLNRYAKEKMSRGFPTGNLEQINSADREVLEQFITDKLLEAEVREAGLGVSEDEVSRYIEQVKKTNRLSDDDLKAALTREGQTMDSYRANVKGSWKNPRSLNGKCAARSTSPTKTLNATTNSIPKTTAALSGRAFATFFSPCRKTRPPRRCRPPWRKATSCIKESSPGRGLRRFGARVFGRRRARAGR
jgi:hypothetical protein